jgi:hypothetical protein
MVVLLPLLLEPYTTQAPIPDAPLGHHGTATGAAAREQATPTTPDTVPSIQQVQVLGTVLGNVTK